MAAEEPGPLPRGLLDRLASQAGASRTDASLLASQPDAGGSRTDASLLAADLAVLQDSGYLKLALPARFGVIRVACSVGPVRAASTDRGARRAARPLTSYP